MKIQHNISAINTNRILGMNNTQMADTLEKLSSGLRINRSADDAAGLAISEKMRSMIHGLTQAEKNCHDAISLVQTAEGALSEVHGMLQRMNAIAVQAANGSYEDSVDRAALQLEFEHLQNEIDYIGANTDFNGMNLFDGTGGTYKTPSGNTAINIVKKENSVISSAQNSITLESLFSQKSDKLENIVYTETVFDYETTQSQAGSATNTSGAGWNTAAATLQTQIVPQAVQAILNRYTAFNYLTGSSIGIGLKLYSDPSSNTLAAVGLAQQSYGGEVTALGYQLSVNMASVDLSTEEGRSALESTIAHEMIHAFMDEAMTAGMTGNTGSGAVASQKFPMWFIEGMAQTASGPGNWTWAMGITGSATTAEISSALKNSSYALANSSSQTGAQYGSGYLACMYLGYLAAGADANMSSSTAAAADIVSGVSSIMENIINGQSLNATINEISGGKYANVSAFESGFATDETALNFIKALQDNGYITQLNESQTGIVGGGLISGDLSASDPYPNNTISGLNLFALDKGNDLILNQYPDDVTILSGGTTTTEGVAPLEGMGEPETYGDFTVTGGTEGIDFVYDEGTGTLTVLTGTALTIEGTGNATTDKIKIGDGITANVTIKNVNIDVSGTDYTAAFEVGDGATLNLTLDGANTLKSGNCCAGLQVSEGETLIITENSTGSLNSTGGEQGAGIGGGAGDSGGTIEISGGEVTATGGVDAAGIGGGFYGSGGTVDINGGTVTATGGEWAAGIGGGGGGGENTGGTINIDGGTVSATGGQGGAGIGGGNNASGGDVTISGGNVTATGGTATSGNSPEAIGAGGENGSGGTFSTTESGTAVITANVKDADDNIISDPTIEQLISDTSGIDVWSATINGVQYPIPPSTGDFTITGGTYGTDYTYDDSTGTLTVLTGTALTIEGTGNATTDKIKIADGTTANVTIKNVNIDVSSTRGACAFEVGDGATLNLTLEGTNTLKSRYGKAGLQVAEGETLVITENSTGSLDATGGTNAAGIGGNENAAGGAIYIKGGTITATGGLEGAGIGGGNDGSGGIINISGGNVTATGKETGAGIGGGRNGSGGDINISGGTVTATGRGDGAGIGGGYSDAGGNINISGGTVTAISEGSAAGIGGGNGSDGSGGNIEISGGTVTATGGSGAAAIGDGQNGTGGTFSTGTNGNADITVSNTDGDTEIADLISDTSGIDVWSATINGVQYPIPPSTGDFTVTGGTYGTDYTYDESTGTLTVLTGTALTIEGTGNATTDKIKIANGTTANVTIRNVNIDVSSTSNAIALLVGNNSSLNLTVSGNNTLKSGTNKAGIQVEDGETLVITEQSTGSLNTVGGGYGAGIGGSYGKSGGSITVNGGTVIAQGGAESAGIGGSTRAGGGNIVINDGNVTAAGGSKAAGIGGGYLGNGGNITISGGEVDATGSSGAGAGVTPAAGIGTGAGGSGGTFSTGTNGDAVITVRNSDNSSEIADLISDTSGIDTWKATINGVKYPIALAGTGNIDLSTLEDDLEITEDGYTIGNKVYEYSGDYTFTGTTDKNVTVSSGGTTNITFDGVTGDDFTVKGNSTVNLTITDDSTMTNVTVEEGSKLNILSGTLKVTDKLDNDGTVENNGTLDNDGEIDNDGTIKNQGTVDNDDGTIKNNNDGIISNSGEINNGGGTVSNNGELSNSGDITNGENGSINNNGNITNNNGGTVDNSGDITNNDSAVIENDGDIINNNSGDITNNDGGIIDNNGSIDNGNGGTITNNGEIKSRPDSTITGDVTGNQPVTAPAKTPDDTPQTPDSSEDNADDLTDYDFEDGTNIWVMQTGARTKDTFAMDIGRMNTRILGIHKDYTDIRTQENANAAIDRIHSAISRLSLQRADIGAYQVRIEHKINNLNTYHENITASESRIRDTDMAEYMMKFTRNQILNNSAQAMLAQANSLQQSVLNLVR
ncbi:MAG: hypothetical protein J6A37_14545 [Oscillospiraceae bacterium]|nr:hypothetical protein [Oscillospiraceae bacterium]